MMSQLIRLVRKHQWHNGWDEEQHLTMWTCKRCGVTRSSDSTGVGRAWKWGGAAGGG
jgi:hypothetical protein